ncbi:phosphoribosylanthranilate isomerase [Ferviditalea candida]|uniref:N-(5'-phosphoribosyl)anthranilate isomerase n=1 Tax=Ferviditalea candida TaxID=3108399 RepID=A0ABU5ZMX9_9BACL|nr:phosphoribosylanthranilate isomerase [Paenibacillaceae bacterium T2]
MGKTAVKICGLTSVGMIESMINLPIDYIGFVFAKSRRQVSPCQAGEMLGILGRWDASPPQSVGVFVDPDLEQLERTLGEAPLDCVQLHGRETPEFCRLVRDQFNVRVFKVFSVSADDAGTGGHRELEPFRGRIDGVFLDTCDPVLEGGTGRTFAWEKISEYHRQTQSMGIPLFVAGGLNADNVGELITAYHPEGVDVSSGVETEGVKDIQKIRSFLERVKTHE